MNPALIQLTAVVVGGLLAIAGSIVTTTLLEKQKQRRDAYTLALAFRGEITALTDLIRERRYIERLAEVIQQMEETQAPFYMPFRVRFKYDRVYESNANRLGLLHLPLPEQIPLFYTCLASVMEDLVSLGDGTYSHLELPLLLRIYQDAHRLLQLTLTHGEEILVSIKHQYHLD